MLPKIAITLGDIAGIGAEIAAKTLLNYPQLRTLCSPILLGDLNAIKQGCRIAGLDQYHINHIQHVNEALNQPDTIDFMQVGQLLENVPLGQISAIAGDGAYRFLVKACELAKQGIIQGIVTAPLNKEAMHLAGHLWPGHTEILAHEFGVQHYSMILATQELYLFHLTTHQSLHSAIDSCTPNRIKTVVHLAHALACALDNPDTAIGVCGINPHAGENGLFGHEEQEQLLPTILALQQQGINVQGPFPADALIPQAVRGKWKMVIACYHDQGHVPFKAVYGDNGVNITAGLPVIRVSVDHGTAFDIAGKGIASEASLVLACQQASKLADKWEKVWHQVNNNSE